jgi:citrate synthase
MSDVTKWWSTEIIDMKPGSINLRGKPIEDLIGKKSFVEMIWFMTTGEEIDSKKLFLLEAALVSSVDHGTAGSVNIGGKNVSYLWGCYQQFISYRY